MTTTTKTAIGGQCPQCTHFLSADDRQNGRCGHCKVAIKSVERDAGLRDHECKWVDEGEVYTGEHQFENGICATCRNEQPLDPAELSRTSLWYESSTGNHQGLITEEETGRNIAVTYDKADAGMVVREHNTHAALVEALEKCVNLLQVATLAGNSLYASPVRRQGQEALKQARGGE